MLAGLVVPPFSNMSDADRTAAELQNSDMRLTLRETNSRRIFFPKHLFSDRAIWDEPFQFFLSDSFNVCQFVDARKGPVVVPIYDDPLSHCVSDSGKRG